VHRLHVAPRAAAPPVARRRRGPRRGDLSADAGGARPDPAERKPSMKLRAALLLAILPAVLAAQVTTDRLLRAQQEPHNWLTYSGAYDSHRYSRLDQITPRNVADLELKWVFQARSLEKFTASPLVVDGVMYVTQAPNDVVALDARTGRVFWVYQYVPSPDSK